MEQILLLLFLVFSVVSALLERRKRKQQLEEAQQKQKQRRDAGDVAAPLELDEDDDEEWGSWPTPSADPFDIPKAKPVRSQAQDPATEIATPDIPTTMEGQAVLQDLQRQTRDVRREQPARRVPGLRNRKPLATAVTKRKVSRYKLSATKARDAIVYAEILGPCKAEQEEEWRW